MIWFFDFGYPAEAVLRTELQIVHFLSIRATISSSYLIVKASLAPTQSFMQTVVLFLSSHVMSQSWLRIKMERKHLLFWISLLQCHACEAEYLDFLHKRVHSCWLTLESD